VPARPFGLLGELQPLARQLFILALELEIADVARELPAFCRMGAALFDDSGIFAELSAENATARRPRCPTALPCPCNSLAAVVAM